MRKKRNRFVAFFVLSFHLKILYLISAVKVLKNHKKAETFEKK